MKKKARIAVTRKLPAIVETRQGEIFDSKFNLDDTPFSESQLIKAVNWADILVPTVTDQVNAKVINAVGPNLKLIAKSFIDGYPPPDKLILELPQTLIC